MVCMLRNVLGLEVIVICMACVDNASMHCNLYAPSPSLAGWWLGALMDCCCVVLAVECSHSAEPNQAAPGSMRPRGGRLPRPSNSLISTAVQPASPHGHLQQPVSPKLNRANSVVSHTAPGGRPQSGRAGTPASVYGQGQGFLLPSRARQSSPVQQLAAEQVSETCSIPN